MTIDDEIYLPTPAAHIAENVREIADYYACLRREGRDPATSLEGALTEAFSDRPEAELVEVVQFLSGGLDVKYNFQPGSGGTEVMRGLTEHCENMYRQFG